MADFEIDGVSYKSKTFDGQLQMKIMLRLMPAFTAVGQMIEELTGLTVPSDDTEERTLTINLKDKDVDFIVDACMNVTDWRLPTGQWKPVREMDGLIAHTGNSRFIVRLKITWAVIGENFAEMFAGFGVDLKDMMAKAVVR